MDKTVLLYSLILLVGVFISAISQVMLKKAAMKKHDSALKEYLNPLVIFAYVLFVGTTFLSILAYRGIPLSMGPVLEATSYLYVTFFGPLTDLASAYLMEPRIAGRLIAIWSGGGQYPVGGTEFNLSNDINAANVIMKSKIELWQVPKNAYEMMTVSLAELQTKVRPRGEIGRYLFDQLCEHLMEEGPRKSAFRTGEAWVLGDNPAVGLILFESRFQFDWMPAPEFTSDMRYIHTGRNRSIRVYNKVENRFILEDLFAKLEIFEQESKK